MAETDKLTHEQRKQARMLELNQETAKIPWSELQKFFASGTTIAVDSSLDLVDAAAELSLDNKQLLQQWMDKQQVQAVSDVQAQQWLDTEALLWAVVMAPYVLVQEVKGEV